MRINEGKLPSDSELMSGEITNAFVLGPAGLGPDKLQVIPREEWAAELQRKQTEEDEWWNGELVDCLLTVELPFRLMLPDGDISVTFDDISVTATLRSDYREIVHGPTFLDSHVNVAYIGPAESIHAINLSSIVPNNMPVFRDMKTTVLFNCKAMSDAFVARCLHNPSTLTDHTQIRRFNRAGQYFDSLAFAHIPFINQLVTAYRSVSLDPYAFEVTEWDVPVWYAEDGTHLVRIGLMPYWDSDEPFALTSKEERTPFFATTLEEVTKQLQEGVAPGKMELLDALSLSYRGRYGDAVRAAVTAIEVALEAGLKRLLTDKGMPEEEVNRSLEESRNSFFERISQYEKLRKQRLPGPVLSIIPYINGVRLREELESVRNLRHKIVHEGIRVDIANRGPMLRAIETMTWLFNWFSQDDTHGPRDNRNYTFFSALRGMRRYPFEYRPDGVNVLPVPDNDAETAIRTTDEHLDAQYVDSLGPEHPDAERFVRMSLNRLSIDCKEGPPDDRASEMMTPRFLAHLGIQRIPVFLLDIDGIADVASANRVAASSLSFQRQNTDACDSLLVVHHQRHLDPWLRETDGAIPKPVGEILLNCGIAAITSVDLYFLINGYETYNWELQRIHQVMMQPGRQGSSPPCYLSIGTVKKRFPRFSAISVELADGETLKLGDTLGLKLRTRWHEETVSSLQVQNNPVQEACGPIRVGVSIQLRVTEISEGVTVYRRE